MVGPSKSFSDPNHAPLPTALIKLSDLVAEFPLANITESNTQLLLYNGVVPDLSNNPMTLLSFRGKKATVPSMNKPADITTQFLFNSTTPTFTDTSITAANVSATSAYDGTVTYTPSASDSTTTVSVSAANVLSLSRTTYTPASSPAVISIKATNRWGNYFNVSFNLIVKPNNPVVSAIGTKDMPVRAKLASVVDLDKGTVLAAPSDVSVALASTTSGSTISSYTATGTTNITASVSGSTLTLSTSTTAKVSDTVSVYATDNYGTKSATVSFTVTTSWRAMAAFSIAGTGTFYNGATATFSPSGGAGLGVKSYSIVNFTWNGWQYISHTGLALSLSTVGTVYGTVRATDVAGQTQDTAFSCTVVNGVSFTEAGYTISKTGTLTGNGNTCSCTSTYNYDAMTAFSGAGMGIRHFF